MNQDNTQDKDKANYVHDEYLDMFTMRQRPVNDAFIDKLAEDLMHWALNDEDALKLTQFYVAKGIWTGDMKRWEARNEKLAKAHQQALIILGNRRETGGLKKKYDAGIVSSTMAHFDPDWKQLAEWRSKLKGEGEGDGKITVVIDAMPSSNLVPDKK